MEKNDTTAKTLTKELLVQNKMGIHARPAAMIVRVTNKFKAEVHVEKEDEQVNGMEAMFLIVMLVAVAVSYLPRMQGRRARFRHKRTE